MPGERRWQESTHIEGGGGGVRTTGGRNCQSKITYMRNSIPQSVFLHLSIKVRYYLRKKARFKSHPPRMVSTIDSTILYE